MDDWEPYLHAAIDYSAEFSERVAELGRALSAELGHPVGHDTDMNYRAGQLLVLYLGPDGASTGDQLGAATMLRIAVSSRGPLWTLLAWRQDAPRHWSPVPLASIPGEHAARTIATIERVLTAVGLHRVPEHRLDDPVPDAVTDLDGAPATLRDVLFCEVC
jgi:hypothetical protein